MASDFVGHYAQQLRDAFAPLIPRDRASALIDFPDSPNCGEHAIWLGQKRLLSELGIPIAYECSAQSYDRDAMAAKIRAGAILMQGGGNLGRHPLRHEESEEHPSELHSHPGTIKNWNALPMWSVGIPT